MGGFVYVYHNIPFQLHVRVDHGAPGRVMPAVDQELRPEPEPVITLVPVSLKMLEKQAPAQEPTAVSIHIIYCMKHLHNYNLEFD